MRYYIPSRRGGGVSVNGGVVSGNLKAQKGSGKLIEKSEIPIGGTVVDNVKTMSAGGMRADIAPPKLDSLRQVLNETKITPFGGKTRNKKIRL